MKYINVAAEQMLDEKEIVKEELCHKLYSKQKDVINNFDKYTTEMLASEKDLDPIESLRTYSLGNWAAVRRLKTKRVNGWIIESHVSNILSDSLGSRPKKLSHKGADRMSRLR